MREERLVTSGIAVLPYTRVDRFLFPPMCAFSIGQDYSLLFTFLQL